MTPSGPPVTIDLGVVGDSEGPEPGSRWPLRRLLAAVAVVACLVTVTGSQRGTPGLGDPLWTGDISLNGFTLGSESLYLAAPNGQTVASRDLRTGAERWRLDISDLPDSTTDVGDGVAVVATRRLTTSTQLPYSGRLNEMLTFVRDATGAVIARTTGYLYLRSEPDLPTVVFTNRPRGTAGCTDPSDTCVDVAGWDVAAGKVIWRLSLPPGSRAVESTVNGRTDGLVEIAGDLLRARDLVSGAVVGSLRLPPVERTGQLLMLRDVLVVARREAQTVVLNAYRRPSLQRAWSVSLPAPPVSNNRLSGFFAVDDCGSVLCLLVDGNTTRFVDVATGSFSPPIGLDVAIRLGDGVFLAITSRLDPSIPPSGVQMVSPTGQILAQFPANSLVAWADSGGRGLLARSGAERTAFTIIDDQGRVRELGSVTGVNLTCTARAAVLACSNGGGVLRVWRLPWVAGSS